MIYNKEMEKILIVEDDKDIRDILKIYLKAESFEAWEAEMVKRLLKFLKAESQT